MAPRGDGGTWQRQISRLLGWEGPGMRWHRTERSGRRFADSAVPMTATKIEATVQPTAPTLTQTVPIHAHVGAHFSAKETSPDTAVSAMAHNIRATERRPPLLTAHAEEISEDKETAQDIPTTAPSVPHDCRLFSGQCPGHCAQGYRYHPRDGRLKAKGVCACAHACICTCVVCVCVSVCACQ